MQENIVRYADLFFLTSPTVYAHKHKQKETSGSPKEGWSCSLKLKAAFKLSMYSKHTPAHGLNQRL